MAQSQQTSTKPTMQNKNIANGQLAFFIQGTGFHKDGYCRTSKDDSANTSIAATVDEEFLNYSSGLKNTGVQPGGKTCLSTRLWKQAFDAAQRGDLSKSAVPKVFLHATHDGALKDVSYSDLKQFEAEREVGGQRGRRDEHHNPESGGGIAKQANDLGGDMGSTAPAPGNMHNKKTEGA